MATKKNNIPIDKNIIQVPLEEAMPDNYLPYAVEVAKERALPDVRDGLKPVHRRIIYGAYMLKALPDKPYYKSARIVGDILGKYHPHGDASVYDAMVILAQNFTTRMPLIDGHGNWGSIDGDSAAAMRYTEARLTPIALELIKDIEKDVVNMVDNYSGSEKEPEVLPCRYPNILVNGAFGIAVGLATNIPPHNLKEVIDAEIALIDNKDISTSELMKYIKGPDLPTGGIIIGKNSLLSAYETGEGKVTLRAKASIEKLENGKLGIVITEFPYRRNKARLLQIISEMTVDKKHAKILEPISDIRDESDRTGIRAVIEFKKSVDFSGAERVLKYLYKKTDLQCNLSFNMVALSHGKPETMGLKTILKCYLEHQKDVVYRRTKRELDICKKRFEIVQGFIKAIGIMDEIIALIRASKSKKDAQNNLMEKYSFSDIQAEAILELMLYRLTGLEIKAFEKEYKELEKEIKRLSKILESEKELLKVIKKEMLEVSEKYGDERRTKIVENDEEAKIDVEELIVEEDIMITMSNDGFTKRVPLKSYNRSNTDISDIDYREGDFNRFLLQSNTKDTMIIFTDMGNMYQIRALNIPEYKWKDKGEKADTFIRGLDLNKEKIIAVYTILSFIHQLDFIFITDKGYIKKTGLDKYSTNYTRIMALKLKENEKLISVNLVPKERQEEFIYIETKLGLSFTIEEPCLESLDRNIMGTEMFTVSNVDSVVNAEFRNEGEFKRFIINVDKNGIVKNLQNKTTRGTSLQIDYCTKIMIFTENGTVSAINGFMLQNIGDQGIDINLLINNNPKNKIISIFTVENWEEKSYVYFFTKRGMVKKTNLAEFKNINLNTSAYKNKYENDSLINVQPALEKDHSSILLITKKAMVIRFNEDNVNPMGKIASGVTGISLKEDDEVIFAELINDTAKENKIVLKSKHNNEKTILTSDIKIQNRAGRGNSAMLIVMDDYIVKIKMVR